MHLSQVLSGSDGLAMINRSDRTHVKDTKNPVQVRPPSSDRLIVVLLVETSRDRISFTPLDDVPLDLGYSPAIECFVSKLSHADVTGSTHIVNCSIALRAD